MKASKIVVAAAMLTLAASGSALAFHDGGVATCDGCHTMHNSQGGAQMTKNALAVGTTNAYLLQGSDDSSTCLVCHGKAPAGSGYKVLDPAAAAGAAPANFTPGGDFGWLKKDYTWTLPRPGSSKGERHGHNVVANDFGLVADATLTTAPGGTYPAANLGCQSCHDPHGKTRIIDAAGTMATSAPGTSVLPIGDSGSYGAMPDANQAVGVYRLLGGAGYAPKSYATSPFTAAPPIAVAPSTYNRAETTTDTRVAYGKGMSEWCANCHQGLHNDAYPTNLRHPAGNAALMTNVLANYAAYVKSGDLTGTNANAYSSLVPYEEGTADRAALVLHAKTDGTAKSGPDATSNVMCLSCHRAHATGWDSMSRWNNKTEFLTVAGDFPGIDAPTQEGKDYASGRTQAEQKGSYYNRDKAAFAYAQRSLCNKCHAKD
ncbi:cytochrome C [Geomobilimonas luticola]|nr:cytochrome C [Geomobilimonas luticola]